LSYNKDNKVNKKPHTKFLQQVISFCSYKYIYTCCCSLKILKHVAWEHTLTTGAPEQQTSAGLLLIIPNSVDMEEWQVELSMTRAVLEEVTRSGTRKRAFSLT